MAEWLGCLLNAGAGELLFLYPHASCRGREEAQAAWIIEEFLVFCEVVRRQLFELAVEDVIGPHIGQWYEELVHLVELLSKESIVGREQENTRYHGLAYRRIGHVGGDETSKGATV